MLTEQKLKSFKNFIQDSSRDEIIWMSGFLAGVSEKAVAAAPPVKSEIATSTEKLVISVLYGTETGNSKKIATKLASVLKNKQHKVTLKALDQYTATNLEKESVLYIVSSTHGDGEPPAAAKRFYDHLYSKQHSLPNLKFAVLALGDSSYPLFCKTGEDIDAKLKEAGALQLLPLEKSDLDFYPVSEAWISNIVNNLPTAENGAATKPLQPLETSKNSKRFYRGEVRTHVNLNDKGSLKETWHIEISTNESIYYLPGDSLGIVPPNTDEDVQAIISLLGADKKQKAVYRNETFTLFDLFKTKLNIRHLPLRIIDKYAKLTQTELPAVRLNLINVLSLYPLTNDVALEDFIAILEPITPRLYSISSSPYAHGNNEIHITVGRDKFWVNDKEDYGFCSSHFAGLNYGDEVIFYINSNDNFRLPQQEKDIIMIGPGTGIAPFRSFIFHRDDEGAPGRNWLFFGDQHFASDFLYQTELLSLFDTGLLTRLNTAFSRDQKEKIYVQHRMLQQSKELYSWIKGGAHVYVCGCKNTMAKDVEATLIEIISREAKIDNKAATEYLERLEDDGRYSKDVY